jgi:hypothetical protein
MSKAEKLAAKILSGKSDKNFSFNDLCYILERAGFQLRSGKGSHRIYYKEGVWRSSTFSRATERRSRIK